MLKYISITVIFSASWADTSLQTSDIQTSLGCSTIYLKSYVSILKLLFFRNHQNYQVNISLMNFVILLIDGKDYGADKELIASK